MNNQSLDEFVKLILKKEISEFKENNSILPTIDHLCLLIISKYNILNSGLLGTNFQKREQGLSLTIRNSIFRIIEEDKSIIDDIEKQYFFFCNPKALRSKYLILTKYSPFSNINKFIKKAASSADIPFCFYEKLSIIELESIKKMHFDIVFLATNFTPYGIKERKVIYDKFKSMDIEAINFLLNKSQCHDLYAISLSLKEKIKYRDFVKDHGFDTFYLDQLNYSTVKEEIEKIKYA